MKKEERRDYKRAIFRPIARNIWYTIIVKLKILVVSDKNFYRTAGFFAICCISQLYRIY